MPPTCRSVALFLVTATILGASACRREAHAPKTVALEEYVAAHAAPSFTRAHEERSAAVQAELESLGTTPGWAGEYGAGDGLGSNVTLAFAQRSGFTIERYGCLGTYDQNHGSVSITDERVRLEFAAPLLRDSPPFPSELLIVKLGGRRYLVPPNELDAFCADLESGVEPRTAVHGRWLLARGDEQLPAQGAKDRTWPEALRGKPDSPSADTDR